MSEPAGVWSEPEQQRLEAGLLQAAGICDPREKWREIARTVGTRDARACAERYQECRTRAIQEHRVAQKREEAEEEEDGCDAAAEDDDVDENEEQPRDMRRIWRGSSAWSSWRGHESSSSGSHGGRGGWWTSSGQGWNAGGQGWQDTEEWHEDAAWAVEVAPEPELTDAQRRALETRSEVEANRERMRLKEERFEEDRKRREAKKAAEEEKWKEEKQKYADEEERLSQERLEHQAQKLKEEADLRTRAQQEAERGNSLFAPVGRAKGSGKAVLGRLGGWAGKASAVQKGQVMRQRREEELANQASSVLANIAAARGAKKDDTEEAAADEEESVPEAGPKTTFSLAGSRTRRAIGPRAGPAAADEDGDEDEAADGAAATSSGGATSSSAPGPRRGRQPIGPGRPGAAATEKDQTTEELEEATIGEASKAKSKGKAKSEGKGDGKGKSEGKGKIGGKDKGKDKNKDKGQGEGKGARKKNKRWWAELDGECPISLAPLEELPSPPFGLAAEGSSSLHYFDARFLAMFLLSSCDFIDPVNRRALSLEECEDLDVHLQRYHSEECGESVADALRLFQLHGAGRSASNLHGVQREATAVLQHLFRFRSARRTDNRGRAVNFSEAALTVVDDDDILTSGPAAASSRPPPVVAAAAAPALDRATSYDFPSLGSGGVAGNVDAAGGSWRGRGGGGASGGSAGETYPALPAGRGAGAKAKAWGPPQRQPGPGRGGGGPPRVGKRR